MKKIYFHILFLCFPLLSIKAQESLPFYEHYILSDDFLINPSFAGANPEIIKVRATHYSQWSGMDNVPSTQTLSAHAVVFDRLSAGIYGFHDSNGASKMTGVNLAAAYHIPIGDDYLGEYDLPEVFSFGISYTGFSQSFDKDKLNPETWNDPLLQDTSHFLSYLNIGTSFYYKGFHGAVSVLDIPLGNNQFVVNNIEPLPAWYYLGGGYRFLVAEGIALDPSFNLALNGQSERQIDLILKSKFYMGENALGVGVSYRMSSDRSGSQALSLSPQLQLELGRLRIGYSYKWGLSEIYKEVGAGHLFSLGFDFANPFDSPRY